MKELKIIAAFFICSTLIYLAPVAYGESSKASPPAGDVTVIADFDSGEKTNNLGQGIEVWLMGDGSDTTQSCQMTFVQGDALGKPGGHSVRLDYDVDSENPAYNGIRTDLNHFDASGFKALNFYIKGDSELGFTKQFKIELIGATKVPSPYMVQGITAEWQKVSVPLSEFFLIKDWTALEKFVVVFADITSDPKTGTIYLDHVHFSK